MSKPEYNDYPLLEVATQAAEHLATGRANVWQKWTCAHCNSRQTMDQMNVFYTSGRCEECGKITQIEKCNYLLEMFNV